MTQPAFLDKIMSDITFMPIKKGDRIWLELRATEEGPLEQSQELMDLVFNTKKLGNLEITNMIFNASYFTRPALEEIRQAIDKKLNSM